MIVHKCYLNRNQVSGLRLNAVSNPYLIFQLGHEKVIT
jgi:hypothetical protein